MEGVEGGRKAVEVVPFEAPGDHIVLLFPDGRRALLDTGSPFSFGRGSVVLLGKDCPLRDEPALMDLAALGDRVGAGLDMLIGADALADLRFMIQWERKTVTFSRDPLPVTGSEVPLETLMGCPVVEFRAAGREWSAFLDTGATISYLDEEVTRPEPFGSRKDFHPGLGSLIEFETPLYRLDLELGGRPVPVTFGDPPPMLQLLLGVSGITSILGSDIWKKWDVLFDLPGKRVVLVEREG